MTADHEARFHQPLGTWVLVAPARANVIPAFDPLAGMPALGGPCPFCPDNESLASPTICKTPSEGAWRARVIANKFPIVGESSTIDGLADQGIGHHELLIETPDHEGDLATYDDAHRRDVLLLLRNRHRELADLPGVATVSLFRNKGLRSGSSQPHPHMQIVATALTLPDPSARWARALAHHAAKHETLLDALLRDELSEPSRIVLENEEWLVVMPYAPQRTFETWVVPKSRRGCFAETTDAEIGALAEVLGPGIAATLGAAGRTDYNLVFRLPPAKSRTHGAAYFLIEIIPRGTTLAGFELVSGTGVVAVTPEHAARLARDAAGRTIV